MFSVLTRTLFDQSYSNRSPSQPRGGVSFTIEIVRHKLLIKLYTNRH